MAWVSEEQIQAILQIRAFEYLQENQPYRLKKTRIANEWELTDHDSFKINGVTSKWHWKSRDIGGVSALRFLMQVDGQSFPDAVTLLSGKEYFYMQPEETEPKKKEFVLPAAGRNCRRVWHYLNRRGISDGVIRYCRGLGILYESAPYHNAVFIGTDEKQVPRYAFLRGIYDKEGKSFKMEQAGSEKRYAFCIPPMGESIRVAVYEACIDALAHMTLEEGKADKYRLVLGGISAPKEGQTRKEMKKPPALEHFLNQHPEIREIEICTDNDFAGRWACEHIRKQYEGKYQIIENLPEKDGADYGDLAKEAVEGQKRSYRTEERGR